MDIGRELQGQVQEVRDRDARPRTKYLGGIRLHPGHSLWEYNPVDGSLEAVEVKVESAYVVSIGGGVTKRKETIDPSKRYVTALNKKNALRKLGVK